MQSKFIEVLGSKIHYLESGVGHPILFLHGMPTSSHVWRNIIPLLAPLGRCIAPDLIGMGKSDKPDIQYSITEHIHFINEFIVAMNLKKITIVMHGWGSIIGCDYAMRNEQNCRGLVFYECYLQTLASNEISLPFQEQISKLNQQENIHEMINNSPYFVDTVIPQAIMNPLSETEMANYREPFQHEGAGRPLSQYLEDLVDDKGQSEVDKIISHYLTKLTKSKIPKLILYSVPGFITTMSTLLWAKENLPNVELIEIGEELHYAQESNPKVMGETISVWLQGIEQHSV